MNINVTIRFGSDTQNRNFPYGTNIGQIVNDPDLRATMGYGDNVRATINGVEQPMSAVPHSGAMITIETKANQKAS